uniref:Integrase catalytic domain-containing protein n=1 Tax=Amphimedon queenslandica TaxID=400682 RepID=A0A1X7V3Y6_AMPQE
VTSSPHYPQSNGLVGRAVKTVKSLLETSQDVYLALLTYGFRPLLWCQLSPAELLM